MPANSPTDACLEMLRAIAVNPGLKEVPRKEMLVSYLRLMFPESGQQSRIDTFTSGAEQYIATAPSSVSQATRGFMDTLNGKLIIEFKADLANQDSRREAELELKRYTAGLWSSRGLDAVFCCIATDVFSWKVWRPVPAAMPSGGYYDADMVCLDLVEEVDVAEPDGVKAENLFLFLKRVLFEDNLLPLTGQNLGRDFGPQSNEYIRVKPIIREIVRNARATSEANLAMDLWEKLQAYNARQISGFDEELYCGHVYLVILSRLMVAAVFQDRSDTTTDDQVIREILTGKFFVNRAFLANLVERDFFGWITDEPWIDDFLPLARRLYHSLRSYDFAAGSSENVLRLIYDEMMPGGWQHVFGQRSTPESLAIPIVESLLQGAAPGYRYLDPCCGTGTFIRIVLQETRKHLASQGFPPQAQLSRLAEAVTGIDIDPVAVILSKAVWALTLADLLTEATSLVNIPIYHADSLFVATGASPATDDGMLPKADPVITFDDCEGISVPVELFQNPLWFDAIVNWCYAKAEMLAEEAKETGGAIALADPRAIAANLGSILGDSHSYTLPGILVPELERRAGALANAAVLLVKEFAERIQANRDGIWAFVLLNSYRPSLIAGRFDLIATNPPWLTMSRLKYVPYKEELERLADHYQAKPGGSAFLHTEIADTFVLHSVKHFLADGGRAAFVMPRILFDGDNHSAFRTRKYADVVPFRVTGIWDLDEVDKLFKIPSCVVFGDKNVDGAGHAESRIPALFWRHLEQDLKDVRTGSVILTRLGEKTAWKEDRSSAETINTYDHYWARFRQGADLMPRTGLFVDAPLNDTAQNIVAVQTSAAELANKDNKLLKGRKFKGLVNRRYLFSTVTSNVLLPFLILEGQIPTLVLPLECQSGRLRIVSTQELIDHGDVTTANWFNEIDGELRKEGKDKIRERIDERGKLTQQSYHQARFLVHYGAGGTHPCAAIQTLRAGSDRPFVADQTTYVFPTSDAAEAYYVMGMLNARATGETIKAFQAKGEFGARHVHKLPLLALPPFDSMDPNHQCVVELSKAAEYTARAVLSEDISDLSRSLHRRRTLMRKALANELEDLDQAVVAVLGI